MINKKHLTEAFIASLGILLFNIAAVPFLYMFVGAKVTHAQSGMVSLILLALRVVWLYKLRGIFDIIWNKLCLLLASLATILKIRR
jgi:hypothetical protein